MKQLLKSIVLFSFSLLLILNFTRPLYAVSNEIDYAIGGPEAKLEWSAKKVTGQHNGTVMVKYGIINLDGPKITSGEIKIDMTTIQVLDIKDPKANTKLTNHLKSDDFFSVAKYPLATFTITKVEPKNDQLQHVIGNLTIKNITHPITIPVTVIYRNDTAQATGTVKIDRTKWDIRYGSGKFFQNLGDKMIEDEFTLKFNFNASRGSGDEPSPAQ